MSGRDGISRKVLTVGIVASALAGAVQFVSLGLPNATAQFVPGTGGSGGGGVASVAGGAGVTCTGATNVTCAQDPIKYRKTFTEVCDDGDRGQNTTFFYFNYVANGTSSGNTRVQTAGHGTEYLFDTGTTAAGRATSPESGAVGFGQAAGDTYCARFSFVMPTALCDGTEQCDVRLGFLDTNNGTIPTDGAWLSFSNAAADFQCNSRTSATTTTVATGVNAVAGTYYYGRVCLNSTTNVTCEIDGVLKATVTATALPANSTGVGAVIVKAAGTNSRTMRQDFFCVSQQFSSDRYP